MRTSGVFLRGLGAIVIFLGLARVGFDVPPRSYPPYAEPNCSVPTSGLPAGLPAPVQRYYSVLFGPTYPRQQVPVLEPAVVTGRGSLGLDGIGAHTLFQAYYSDHESFRRAMDITWLGIPVVHTRDASNGGRGFSASGSAPASGPQVSQAENLAYWAEAVWMPSEFFLDPRIRWEAVDSESARLVVPLGASEDSLLVSFDPQTGFVQSMSAQRYRGAQASQKSVWRVDFGKWQAFHDVQVPTEVRESWDDQPGPAQVLTVENIEYAAHGFPPLVSPPAFEEALTDGSAS